MTPSLEDIGAEMRRQDNRGTQNPLFVIQVWKEEVTHEDFSDYFICVNDEGQKMDEEEDLCEDCVGEDERKEPCVGCGFKQRLPVKEMWEFDLHAGVFFTAKACQEHIDANKHHYERPRVYAIASWRNPEMQTVMCHLASLNGERPNWYSV